MKKPDHGIKLVTGEHYYIDSVTYEVLRQGTNKKDYMKITLYHDSGFLEVMLNTNHIVYFN